MIGLARYNNGRTPLDSLRAGKIHSYNVTWFDHLLPYSYLYRVLCVGK